MAPSRTRVLLAVAAVAFLLAGTGCRAEATPEPSPNSPSSAELVETPKEHDGTEVTFRGEAIGEAMVRRDMAWLHINDDAYYVKNVEEGAHLGGYNSGMAVWIGAADAEQVTYFGDYKHEGDIIEARGMFNAACAEHGGDMDIHATALTVVAPGRNVVDPVSPLKAWWAAGLSLLAGLLFAFTRLQHRLPLQ